MTMLHFDGFEWMGTPTGTQNPREYIFSSGAFGSPGTGRLFGQCFESGSTVFTTRSFGLRNVLFTGFAFKLTTTPSTNKSMSFLKGGIEQFRWEYTDNAGTGFQLVFKRGSTTLGTSSTFAYGQWHYFEIGTTVHITTGAIELRRNEQVDLTLTGLNNANEGSNGADSFKNTWSGSSAGAPNWDDWYILDDQGADNNTFLGDCAIEGVTVTAEGATIQWTPVTGTNNAALVDDGNTQLDTNNYNSSDTVGQKDTFVTSDLAFLTGTIFAFKIEAQLAMSAAGSRNVGVRWRDSGGTEAAGGTFAVSSTTYQNFSHIFERNPNTAALWSNADINGGQIGYEVLA